MLPIVGLLRVFSDRREGTSLLWHMRTSITSVPWRNSGEWTWQQNSWKLLEPGNTYGRADPQLSYTRQNVYLKSSPISSQLIVARFCWRTRMMLRSNISHIKPNAFRLRSLKLMVIPFRGRETTYKICSVRTLIIKTMLMNYLRRTYYLLNLKVQSEHIL